MHINFTSENWQFSKKKGDNSIFLLIKKQNNFLWVSSPDYTSNKSYIRVTYNN